MQRVLLIALLSLIGLPPASAQDHEDNDPGLPNAAGPTFGGKQLWTDELVYHDWRIQRNAWTGHCRLLDDRNYRRAWGTVEECRAELEELKAELNLPPMSGHVVLLLHGLVRSRQSMQGLCEFLRENSDFTVLNVSYASTRNSLHAHSQSLARVVANLGPQVTEVSFAAHSLGNLVIRHYLHERQGWDLAKQESLPRVGRIVMLAPPNQGAQLAEHFQDSRIFQTIWGKSGQELAKEWAELESQLATPRCEFGIIAGGRGEETGNNPLLDGDDDFVVSVDETRLLGATDFTVVPVSHSRIMDQEIVCQYTLRFLQHGYFISVAGRQPIRDDELVGNRHE